MSNTFEFGDKVERILFSNEGVEPGSIGTILDNTSKDWYVVDFDGNIGKHLGYYLAIVEKEGFTIGDVYHNDNVDLDTEIVMVSDNYIITKDSDDGALNAYIDKDFIKSDWKLKGLDVVEVTLEEIADKFSISIDKLRIKD